ncbi:MAG TPA: hypothetical protein VHW69_01090 [Rhizomicrobium sp.]|nr:hypothetical protein [Rhizomicrobium sp.]
MKAILLVSAAVLALGVPALGQNVPWHGYGGDAQHSAQAPATGQSLSVVHWSIPVDLAPPGFLGIHYAEPMITAANTVLVPIKVNSQGTYQMEAHSAADGSVIWKDTVSYRFPPYDWIPSIPAHLTEQSRLYFAGSGGTVRFHDAPDSASGDEGTVVFYGKKNYKQNKSAYDSNVMVSTPITADANGNIYFGFTVIGSTPLGLKNGIARISAGGKGTWVAATDAANDAQIDSVPTNCAPAISRDGKTIYIAVADDNSGRGILLGLDAKTLKTKYSTPLTDPYFKQPALVWDISSASPTIGPDGDVYYGVVESDGFTHNDRGWLLHFDATLKKAKIPGSFGWDDTVSVVPSSMVPSYTGSSSYLLMSKYNNYDGIGTGDGHNKIAILDPGAKENDPVLPSVKVMNEVLTILGPTQEPGERKGVVYEWCINSAVVDVANKSVIANSEDGHTYRWDLTNNTLTSALPLNAPTGEAYTPTLIGPDGQIYSINDAHLYAIGN